MKFRLNNYLTITYPLQILHVDIFSRHADLILSGVKHCQMIQ